MASVVSKEEIMHNTYPQFQNFVHTCDTKGRGGRAGGGGNQPDLTAEIREKQIKVTEI